MSLSDALEKKCSWQLELNVECCSLNHRNIYNWTKFAQFSLYLHAELYMLSCSCVKTRNYQQIDLKLDISCLLVGNIRDVVDFFQA